MIHFNFIIENYNDAKTIAAIETRMSAMFNNTFCVACESAHKLYGVTKCYAFEVNHSRDDVHLEKLCSLSKEFPNTIFSIISNGHHKQEFFNGLFQSRYPRVVYYCTETTKPETYEEYSRAMAIVFAESLGY